MRVYATAFKTVLVVCIMFFTLGLMAQFRAPMFGISVATIVAYLVLGGILTGACWAGVHLAAHMGRFKTGGPMAAAIAAACAVLLMFAVECWFQLDERAFADEALTAKQTSYDRARRWPFRSFGLLYLDGRWYAHD
jgi:hypothetical protein